MRKNLAHMYCRSAPVHRCSSLINSHSLSLHDSVRLLSPVSTFHVSLWNSLHWSVSIFYHTICAEFPRRLCLLQFLWGIIRLNPVIQMQLQPYLTVRLRWTITSFKKTKTQIKSLETDKSSSKSGSIYQNDLTSRHSQVISIHYSGLLNAYKSTLYDG